MCGEDLPTISSVLYLGNRGSPESNRRILTVQRLHSPCSIPHVLVQRVKPYSNNPSGLVSGMIRPSKCYNDIVLNNDNHQVSSARLPIDFERSLFVQLRNDGEPE